MRYLVPEYYKYFECKRGECRHSCCDGWAVNISLREYYRLLGLNCSEYLRTRLDCALKIRLQPSNECYAVISSDWQGICMLHGKDGLCILQSELGENSLPEVCRLYPRSARQLNESCSCSCSASCEKVVELLMAVRGTLRFEEVSLSIDPEFIINRPAPKYDYLKSITILQNRSLSLTERFISLCNYYNGAEFELKKPDNLFSAYLILYTINKYYENNLSINDYCEISQSYYSLSDKAMLSIEDLNIIAVKHKLAAEHLEKILPDFEILMEQLIVNHMFHNKFPYTDTFDETEYSLLSLVITYSFLRFQLLAYASNLVNPDKLVDFFAAMFRLIEHSDFKQVVVTLFRKGNFSSQECLPQLLNI